MKSRIAVLSILSLFASWSIQANAAHEEGERVTGRIERAGKNMQTSQTESQRLESRIYRVYTTKTWETESMPVPRCHEIPGRGDGDWKGYWNTNDRDEKINRLSQAIAGVGQSSAREIVDGGYLKTPPRSWDAFAAEIERADHGSGFSKEVLGQYGDRNREQLGYATKMPDISGNGDWKGYWEASRRQKADRLRDAIRGLSMTAAEEIVDRGFFDRKPRDWRAFAAEITDADHRINDGFSFEVLINYGRENMRNLGYSDADACETSNKRIEVLKETEEREYDRTEIRDFDVQFINGLLLDGEKESFDVVFDGFKDSLEMSSDFNSYRVRRSETARGLVKYELQGERKSIAPPNRVRIDLRNVGGELIADLSDLAYDREIAKDLGETRVSVAFYESRILFDKKLGEMDLKIVGDKVLDVDTGIRPVHGKKVYAEFRIRRVGGKFYNDKQSDKNKSEKLRF